LSFSTEQLEQNYTAFMDTIVRQKPPAAKGQYVRTVAVSSTMGPGFRIDPAIYR
jgi:large subunit ribosomal protein L1